MSVEIKAADADMLVTALRALDLKYAYDKNTGKFVVYTNTRKPITIDTNNQIAEVTSENQQLLNDIKVSYSKTAIVRTALKKRWVLKKMAENKFQAKRY
jgi:uncharacterized protein YtpQ (UPF0354 family)